MAILLWIWDTLRRLGQLAGRAGQTLTAEPASETAAEVRQTPDSGSLPTLETLERMPVVQLRALARELNVGTMTRQEIRFAKKDQLLTELRTFLQHAAAAPSDHHNRRE